MKNMYWIQFFGLTLIAFCFMIKYTNGNQLVTAEPLLVYDHNAEKFQLHQPSLNVLRKLSAPIKVISAVGDARIGKSNALSIMANLIESGGDPKGMSHLEVFKSCHTALPCTKGVWMLVIKKGGINYLLLDVEGTDLGDETITTTLSLFTAFLSSEIMLFVKETLNNHALHFLYHMARMREARFAHLDRVNFARLSVVVRDALEPPPEQTLKDYIVDALSQANKLDGMNEARLTIAKEFPAMYVTVHKMPYVELQYRSSIKKFMDHLEYREMMVKLSSLAINSMKRKTSVQGAEVDGELLMSVADSILQMIESDKWEEWESDWTMFERMLCTRSMEKHIFPLEELTSAVEIVEQMIEALVHFKAECVLDDEILEGEKVITRTLEKLRAEEDRDRHAVLANEAEEKADIAEQEKNVAVQARQHAEKVADNIAKQLENARETVERTQAALKTMQQEYERLRQKRKKRRGGLFRFIGDVVDHVVELVDRF